MTNLNDVVADLRRESSECIFSDISSTDHYRATLLAFPELSARAPQANQRIIFIQNQF